MRTLCRIPLRRTLAVALLALCALPAAAAAPPAPDDLAALYDQIFALAPDAAVPVTAITTIYCCVGVHHCCTPMTTTQCQALGGFRYLHEGNCLEHCRARNP